MSNAAHNDVEQLRQELVDVKRELAEFRAFFKETIAHYDKLLPERLAIAQRRNEAQRG